MDDFLELLLFQKVRMDKVVEGFSFFFFLFLLILSLIVESKVESCPTIISLIWKKEKP